MIHTALECIKHLMGDLAAIPFVTDRGKTLYQNLHHALRIIAEQNLPPIPNPEGCQRRASVACIIRFNPKNDTVHQVQSIVASKRPVLERLQLHFDQKWVQQSDPEILFIRRAARNGDRWTSQVALPGGKRDPEDPDDLFTSARETREEVGLDITSDEALFVGKLPERIITTEWGTTPLMVLCPFVYLLMRPKTPKLTLQPDEIASTHWVPIRMLLSSSLWTTESADASDRFAKQGGPLLKLAFRAMVGHMIFGAIRLAPSESQEPAYIASKTLIQGEKNPGRPQVATYQMMPASSDVKTAKPLLLWGLTHGIVVDFLRLIPDSEILQSWRWPTFSAYDVRLLVWLISRDFRRKKLRGLHARPDGPFLVVEEGFASRDNNNGVGPKEIVADHLRWSGALGSVKPFFGGDPINNNSYSTVHYMLQGYFELVQKGMLLSMALRVGFAAALLTLIIRMRTPNL